MATADSFDFDGNVDRALADGQLRTNLRRAMDILVEKRRAVFDDPEGLETLRAAGNAIKRRALSKLPELLEQLEKNCSRNGIKVHWAEDPEEANRIVYDIVASHGAGEAVKGKSMVSEEMHLNRYLEDRGIDALETDLGEFIIQLNGETPSHIIVPAIHKNKDEVAHIFHDKIPDAPYTEDVEALTAIARKTLRTHFTTARIGVSGVNFAVAETGTLLLVENEGNGRMCTTAPDVHVAVMGLEKVVEKLADVPPLLRLLTGSATGQLITTYVNMITSPRKADEKDGPKEVHLVILDNGRSRILADPELRQTLLCIRCGTCLNHCPVYLRLCRGLPGENTDPRAHPPPSKRKLRRRREKGGSRRRVQQKPRRNLDLEGVGTAQRGSGRQPPQRQGSRTPRGQGAEGRSLAQVDRNPHRPGLCTRVFARKDEKRRDQR